jgi:hypothetical protein
VHVIGAEAEPLDEPDRAATRVELVPGGFDRLTRDALERSRDDSALRTRRDGSRV